MQQSPRIGVYVHIPFCLRKCPYCDFESGTYGEGRRLGYLAALNLEIRSRRGQGITAQTLFLGGGTPSLLNTEQLSELVTTLRDSFSFESGGEWSIECNPGTVTPASLEAMRRLGFNRISLGVQSFNDAHLRALGRIHDSGQARQAFRWAREAGFGNISLDLIFGLRGQKLEEWEADLQEAFALGPEHLSLYGLTIEPSTDFGRRAAEGESLGAEEELSADMYERAMDLTSAAGYSQDEISNYARPGRECRHNLIYWRNQPYLGFGVSAASFFEDVRWSNTNSLSLYEEGAASGRVAHKTEERLEGRAALAEGVILGLRTSEGIAVAREIADTFGEAIHFLSAQQLIEIKSNQMRLTRRGKLLASEVALEFLSEPSQSQAQP